MVDKEANDIAAPVSCPVEIVLVDKEVNVAVPPVSIPVEIELTLRVENWPNKAVS